MELAPDRLLEVPPSPRCGFVGRARDRLSRQIYALSQPRQGVDSGLTMFSDKIPAPDPLQGARAPVVGSSRTCQVCGKPLEGRERVCCSGRCRAVLSRLREQARMERSRKIRRLLDMALRLLEQEACDGR